MNCIFMIIYIYMHTLYLCTLSIRVYIYIYICKIYLYIYIYYNEYIDIVSYSPSATPSATLFVKPLFAKSLRKPQRTTRHPWRQRSLAICEWLRKLLCELRCELLCEWRCVWCCDSPFEWHNPSQKQ